MDTIVTVGTKVVFTVSAPATKVTFVSLGIPASKANAYLGTLVIEVIFASLCTPVSKVTVVSFCTRYQGHLCFAAHPCCQGHLCFAV